MATSPIKVMYPVDMLFLNSVSLLHYVTLTLGSLLVGFLQASEIVISLPEQCLLTTSTVLRSYMQEYLKRCSS